MATAEEVTCEETRYISKQRRHLSCNDEDQFKAEKDSTRYEGNSKQPSSLKEQVCVQEHPAELERRVARGEKCGHQS